MVSVVSETHDPNALRAGDYPVYGRKVTIADSVALTAGAVLGRITSGGKYILSASGAGDGSQTPVAILAADADASDGDVEGLVYFSGDFAADKLSFGTGHTATTVETAFRAAHAPLFITTRLPA